MQVIKTTISHRFNGLFAPHWRTDARGTMVGITQYTTKGHICRATLEVRLIETFFDDLHLK